MAVRNKLLNFKVDPSELKSVKDAAAAQGLTPSQFMREALADRLHAHHSRLRAEAKLAELGKGAP